MKLFFVIAVMLVLAGCRKDPIIPTEGATPYYFEVPAGFPIPIIPSDNPFTVEGIDLGRHLFYDERLSGDNTMACASCHFQNKGFSDTTAFSKGILGVNGLRNSMPIFNLAWSPTLFWDGRSANLETQILFPVTDPVEMHETWSDAVDKIKMDTYYQKQFKIAFGEGEIDSTKVAKAIAQFIRTMVSND